MAKKPHNRPTLEDRLKRFDERKIPYEAQRDAEGNIESVKLHGRVTQFDKAGKVKKIDHQPKREKKGRVK